ncbi:7-methyl-GTP pyrophosphatase [Labeo rohita]|uniref:7-methyl-GTP pyrophosphatase n=1 Tax=Labeo rohita TaxID=84645 RepID=A0ABQ8LIY1_LABRO|nr:7-methyl-GTP pyrophosphatase [Labeo rohita]
MGVQEADGGYKRYPAPAQVLSDVLPPQTRTRSMHLPPLQDWEWKVIPAGLTQLHNSVRNVSAQVQGCPVHMALSPRVFTKLAKGALAPLWEQGIHILNLDDWLIIAHSRDLLCKHRDLELWHLSHLELWINWEKSKLSPCAEQMPRHVIINTDASETGWLLYSTGRQPRAPGQDLDCSGTSIASSSWQCFSPFAGVNRCCRGNNIAMSQTWLKSLRAVHIPRELNRAADALSRQLTLPGEWRLYPQAVQLIWSRFRKAQVDLFASPKSSHCQLFYSLTEAPLSTDALAHS